jgi:hypothetical protein
VGLITPDPYGDQDSANLDRGLVRRLGRIPDVRVFALDESTPLLARQFPR